MARTWPVTRRKVLMLRAFDTLARPLFALAIPPERPPRRDIRKILLLELWHMGDVVLATPALDRLRKMFPAARLTLLAKDHAVGLLQSSDLVDEIITFDFPWTAMSGKYRIARYDREAISRLIRRLRAEDFDLSIDCRMDLRSNLLARYIGARRRIGYDFGGGSFLLTDVVSRPPADQHKVDDWMGLLNALESRATDRATPDPRLNITASEVEEAANQLASYEIGPADLVLGVHPGGSHESKRWSADNFGAVARELAHRHSARPLVFVDPDGCGGDMDAGPNAIFIRTSIREMMALLTFCDLLLCNDSGPMHVAAALGTPVVTVFRTGNPSAYGPRGLDHAVVGTGAPWGQTADVEIDDVIIAGDAALARVAARKAGSAARA